ncbi:MAG TPA: uroporphyrinogen decarboxylase family protein [Armatimonadota bacterium]|nr:uroporphyrinogen decarboxylase family protein [Armatimonadota bacterium]
MTTMTRKERFERALRREEVDRLPFWAKIFGPDYLHPQDPKYSKLTDLELADHLDLDHMGGGGSCVVGSNDVTEHSVERDGSRRTMTWKTPDRTLVGVDGFDEGSQAWHPIEFAIKDYADLRAARDIYAHTTYEAQDKLIENSHARLRAVGDRGITMTGMGISPLMDLIQHMIGPENTYFFFADYPDEMDELIAIMHQDRVRYIKALVASTPLDYICCVENTSTTLMSPEIFEKYCWQHLMEYGTIMADAGKQQVLHQCGKLRQLLPKIDELPAVAIEAYTTPPVGDTTLADRVNLSPNTAIIGGTDVTLWLKPANAIVDTIEGWLRDAGTMNGVVLTSAGVMTPHCPMDRIIEVRNRLYDFTPAMFN